MLHLVGVCIPWERKGVNFNVVSFLKSEAASPEFKIIYKLTIINNVPIKNEKEKEKGPNQKDKETTKK